MKLERVDFINAVQIPGHGALTSVSRKMAINGPKQEYDIDYAEDRGVVFLSGSGFKRIIPITNVTSMQELVAAPAVKQAVK